MIYQAEGDIARFNCMISSGHPNLSIQVTPLGTVPIDSIGTALNTAIRKLEEL